MEPHAQMARPGIGAPGAGAARLAAARFLLSLIGGLAAAVQPGAVAAAGLCSLIQMVTADLADPAARLADPGIGEARARLAEGAAATYTASATHLLWLADAYRDGAGPGAPRPGAFATRAPLIVARLQDDFPECAPGGARGQEAARDPEGGDAGSGPARPSGIPVSPEEEQARRSSISWGGGVLAAMAGGYWLYWRRTLRHERAERFPCQIAARFTRSDEPADCVIENITELGAKLRLEGPGLAVGARIALTCPLFDCRARVRWAKGPYAGIVFDRALSPELLQAAAGANITRADLATGGPDPALPGAPPRAV